MPGGKLLVVAVCDAVVRCLHYIAEGQFNTTPGTLTTRSMAAAVGVPAVVSGILQKLSVSVAFHIDQSTDGPV